MKWVRWWGLAVFFLVVLAIGAIWMFLVDDFIKHQIEQEGTAAVGAKVELDQADLTLFPVGLTLRGLQVTNPDEPMTNAVEIGKISMAINSLLLLSRKMIIEEMRVESVQFGTPRSSSGAVPERLPRPHPAQPPQGTTSLFQLPPLEVPDVQTIVQKENLETLKLIATIQADIQREKVFWKQRLDKLPGKAQFDRYREQIKQLQSATKGGLEGVLGGVTEVESLKKEIEQDFDEIQGARKEFEEKIALLKTRLAQVKEAPQHDIEHLKEKYSLSPQGLANLGQTLLGHHVGGILQKVAQWYGILSPYLEKGLTMERSASATPDVAPVREKGLDVRFQEFHPLPDFLIRLAHVSLNLAVGQIGGTIENVTPDQATLGIPLKFNFSGEKLQDLHAMHLSGTLDHIQPEQSKDAALLTAQGYRFHNLMLSQTPEWPVALQNGVGDFRVQGEMKSQHLTATGSGTLSGLTFLAGHAQDSNPLTKTLSSAVSDIHQLSFTFDVAGTLEQHDVKVHSDLDRILKDAAGKIVKELAADFEKKLQSAVSEKVAGPLKSLTDEFMGFQSLAQEFSRRLGQKDDLLKSLLGSGLQKKSLPSGFKLPF